MLDADVDRESDDQNLVIVEEEKQENLETLIQELSRMTDVLERQIALNETILSERKAMKKDLTPRTLSDRVKLVENCCGLLRSTINAPGPNEAIAKDILRKGCSTLKMYINNIIEYPNVPR